MACVCPVPHQRLFSPGQPQTSYPSSTLQPPVTPYQPVWEPGVREASNVKHDPPDEQRVIVAELQLGIGVGRR